MYDIVIIGGGAAGLTAALYALRGNKTVMVLEKNAFGGQIAFSPKVENYPGMESMSGSEFADRLLSQVINLGAEVDIVTVTGINDFGAHKTVLTEDGVSFEGRCVIIATGARHRHLGVTGEKELAGKGVCYCAVCDGDFYRGKEVAMVGGGNTALQEAIFLSDLCKKVTVIQNLDFLTGEEKLIHALNSRENIRCILGAQVAGIEEKDGEVHSVRIRREGEGAEERIRVDALFVAIGLEPENKPFAGVAPLDASGYIRADEGCLTRTPGIFTAGDCRTKSIRQLTTAVADGSVAAIAACIYLN